MCNAGEVRHQVIQEGLPFAEVPGIRHSLSPTPLVQPIARPRYTALITGNSDLIHHGLEQARLALCAVINMTNAQLRPELGLIATALPGLLSAALEGGG